MYQANGDSEWFPSVTVTTVLLAATAVSDTHSEVQKILTLAYSTDAPSMSGKPATLLQRYLRVTST